MPRTVQMGARRAGRTWRDGFRAVMCQTAILSLLALVIGGPMIIRSYGQAMVIRATREGARLRRQLDEYRVRRAAAEETLRLVESPQVLDRVARKMGMKRATEVAIIPPSETKPANRRCALADVQIR